jgi:SPP1 gp7 family putative phage head morphogenesis protein
MDQRTSAADIVADEVRAHAIDLMRFDAQVRREILGVLIELERDLVRQLIQSELEAPLSSATTVRLQEMLEHVRASISSAYNEADGLLRNELAPLAESETRFTAAALRKGVTAAFDTVSLSAVQVQAIASDVLIDGAPTREWWSRQAGDVLNRFKDQVRQGMAAGETNSDIVRRIRGGTKGGEPVRGVMEIARRNAETLVRSSVQAVANRAQIDTYRANGDLVKALVTLVTLDGRTSSTCIARSGLRYTLEGKPIGHKVPFLGGPPYHPNCRTVMVPQLKSFREIGINVPDVPASTRASMDGQVPADISFADWLKTKPAAFQDDLLGAGKARLWREGRIDLADLIDQSGRPLTLKQLEERHPN